MRTVLLPRLLPVFLAVAAVACGPASGDPERTPMLVFAAASLRDVAGDLAADFESRNAVDVITNFAGSNVLAQQIDAAPRADVFLCADEAWVDFLETAGRTVDGTRRSFLSNRLVLIAHREATFQISAPEDLATIDFRFLAMADPEAVPAGRYARAALGRVRLNGTDVWSAVADRVVPALDVRAALALVESDPRIVGIVYRTDALTSDKVRVLYELPPSAGAPIRYSAVLIAGGDNPEAGRLFLDYLTSPAALAIAKRHGFGTP